MTAECSSQVAGRHFSKGLVAQFRLLVLSLTRTSILQVQRVRVGRPLQHCHLGGGPTISAHRRLPEALAFAGNCI